MKPNGIRQYIPLKAMRPLDEPDHESDDEYPGWFQYTGLALAMNISAQFLKIRGTFRASHVGLEGWTYTVIDALLQERPKITDLREVASDQIVLTVVRNTCLSLAIKYYSEAPIWLQPYLADFMLDICSMPIGLPSVLADRVNSFGPVTVGEVIYRPELECIWALHFVNIALRTDSDILKAFKEKTPLFASQSPSQNVAYWVLFKKLIERRAHSGIFPDKFEAQVLTSESAATIYHGFGLDPGKKELLKAVRFSEQYIALHQLRERLVSTPSQATEAGKKLMAEFAAKTETWSTDIPGSDIIRAVKSIAAMSLPVNECIRKAISFVDNVSEYFTKGGGMWQLMSYNDGTLSCPFEFSLDEALEGVDLQFETAKVKVPEDAYTFPNPITINAEISTKRRQMMKIVRQSVLKAPGSPAT